MTPITYTKNYKQEIVFTNEWNDPENKYFLQLIDGDITPLASIPDTLWKNKNNKFYIPYIPNSCYPILDNFHTFDNITPDFSKYIPKDHAILFLSVEDLKKYKDVYKGDLLLLEDGSFYGYQKLDTIIEDTKKQIAGQDIELPKKITIFVPEIHAENIQEINNIAKELKEKYYAVEVWVVATHCLLEINGDEDITDTLYYNTYFEFKGNIDMDVDCIENWSVDKLITTTSTGILEPQNKARLQVIDAMELFENSIWK